MIYKRYFLSEIAKSAATVFALAVLIYASDCSINYLGDSIAGSIPASMVGQLILLRVGIALEVILPVTFFLAVIIALGRFYKDSEMTALAACGLGMPQVLRLIFVLSLPVALLSAFTSLYIRPTGWTKIYRVLDEAQSQFDISRLCANTFLELRAGQVVFFAEEVQASDHTAGRVFVRVTEGDEWKVIWAQQMTQTEDAEGQRMLSFRNGHAYEPPFKGDSGKITRFNQAEYPIPAESSGSGRYRRKATPTEQLVGSARMEDITELQWRLSAPLSTILLALLGVPLSKSKPRKGKFAKIGFAVVVFAIYFQLFVIARTWVDDSVVAPVPGIWWVPALLIGLVIVELWRTGDVFYRR